MGNKPNAPVQDLTDDELDGEYLSRLNRLAYLTDFNPAFFSAR